MRRHLGADGGLETKLWEGGGAGRSDHSGIGLHPSRKKTGDALRPKTPRMVLVGAARCWEVKGEAPRFAERSLSPTCRGGLSFSP